MTMKTIMRETKEEWLEDRRGRITGTSADKILSKRDKKPLKGFYQLLADRVAIPETDENKMDRGLRLENEAIECFCKETGKKVTHMENTLCYREDEPNIAYSPDGIVEGEPADVEVKCKDTALHIEAIINEEIPSEYEAQIIQGFVVNDELKTRYLILYDPRCPRELLYFTLHRADYAEKIATTLAEQKEILKQLSELENKILNF